MNEFLVFGGIGLILLVVASIYVMVLKTAHNIYAWSTISNSEGLRDGLENGEFDAEFVNLPKEEFRVPSPLGYDIAGFYIPGTSENTILLSHGVTRNRWGMMKYASIFLRNGWNIVAMDHRKHGDSGGHTISYGIFEVTDMRAVTDATLSRFPETRVLGILGESMGASIALQYAPLDSRVDFVVADCPFDDFYQELQHRAKDIRLPHFLKNIILKLTVRRVYNVAGYHVEDIKPGEAILNTSIPVLLCHGDADNYVPTAMSVRMYEQRRNIAPTDLALYPNSKHAQSIMDHREDYEKRLMNWFFERLSIAMQ